MVLPSDLVPVPRVLHGMAAEIEQEADQPLQHQGRD